MTAITHPMVTTHHLITALVAAAVSAGLTVSLMLSFGSTTSARPALSHVSRADSTLCAEFANATQGSPAAFRLADAITAQGSC